MGSSTSICSDKTAIMHLTVVKSCIWMTAKETSRPNEAFLLRSELLTSALKFMIQSILNNTEGEVVNKNGKSEILGTATDTALLDFGLSLGGNFMLRDKYLNFLKLSRPIL